MPRTAPSRRRHQPARREQSGRRPSSRTRRTTRSPRHHQRAAGTGAEGTWVETPFLHGSSDIRTEIDVFECIITSVRELRLVVTGLELNDRAFDREVLSGLSPIYAEYL